MKRRVAIVGSHGLYASYGGWDQLVNNLAETKSRRIEYLIFNSVETSIPQSIPDGVRVKRIVLPASGFWGLFYDFWSILTCYWKVDIILLLGVQGIPLAVLFKIFKNVKIISNLGGIEWERPKFGTLSKLYLRFCFYLSAKYSESLILDNQHYLTFISTSVETNIHVIPYGGTIDTSLGINDVLKKRYPFIGSNYFLSISRALKDNMMYELCESFINTDKILVLISNFSSSAYGESVYNVFKDTKNIFLINGLYFKPELDLVRRSCLTYIHTHTLCGTAPSLVEMIVSGRPIISVDTPQNRFTLHNEGYFYQDFDALHDFIRYQREFTQYIPSRLIAKDYDWERIVHSYESLYS